MYGLGEHVWLGISSKKCSLKFSGISWPFLTLFITSIKGGSKLAAIFEAINSQANRDTSCIVLGPKRTSRDRVKRVATLPASFASGAIPPTSTSSYSGMSSLTAAAEGDKRRLDIISRDIMRRPSICPVDQGVWFELGCTTQFTLLY